MRLLVTLALVGTVALALASASHGAKAKRVATEADIELARHTGMGTVRFLGDVHSRRSKCEKGREVTLVHGTVGAVATTRTDYTGDWELTPSTLEAPDGTYTVEVSRKRAGKENKKLICKPATSNEATLAD